MLTFTLLIIGLTLLLVGGTALVRGASGVAESYGISPLVVGLTVVAFGTSAPELAVSVEAALKGDAGIALGNVVGSNIFNILAILGVGAVISPIPFTVSQEFFTLNFPVMLGTAILLSVFVWLRKPVGRPAGIVFLAWYVTYIALLVLRSRGLVG